MTEKNQTGAASAAEAATDAKEKDYSKWLDHPTVLWIPRCFLGLAVATTGVSMFADGLEATDGFLASSLLCAPAFTLETARVILRTDRSVLHSQNIPSPVGLAATLLVLVNTISTAIIA